MRWASLPLILAVIALSSCAGGDPPPHLIQDGAATPDGPTDGMPVNDGLLSIFDAEFRDARCTLGTVDNCGYCGDKCLPEKDTPATARVCEEGKCSIQCQEEHYDVNGNETDGCEVEDDLPVHETELAAVNLGDVGDCDNSKTATGVIPSDDRKHLKAPVDRPNGRPDWFKLHIDDKPGCIVEAEVDVFLHGLPPASSYKAVAYYVCDNSKGELSSDEQLGYGGTMLSLNPSTSCTLIGDDSGTVFVKITKESGPHSGTLYQLKIKP